MAGQVLDVDQSSNMSCRTIFVNSVAGLTKDEVERLFPGQTSPPYIRCACGVPHATRRPFSIEQKYSGYVKYDDIMIESAREVFRQAGISRLSETSDSHLSAILASAKLEEIRLDPAPFNTPSIGTARSTVESFKLQPVAYKPEQESPTRPTGLVRPVVGSAKEQPSRLWPKPSNEKLAPPPELTRNAMDSTKLEAVSYRPEAIRPQAARSDTIRPEVTRPEATRPTPAVFARSDAGSIRAQPTRFRPEPSSSTKASPPNLAEHPHPPDRCSAMQPISRTLQQRTRNAEWRREQKDAPKSFQSLFINGTYTGIPDANGFVTIQLELHHMIKVAVVIDMNNELIIRTVYDFTLREDLTRLRGLPQNDSKSQSAPEIVTKGFEGFVGRASCGLDFEGTSRVAVAVKRGKQVLIEVYGPGKLRMEGSRIDSEVLAAWGFKDLIL